jgi:integrase
MAVAVPGSLARSHSLPAKGLGLRGKKGTFGGVVVPYEVFPDQPIGSWKTAWKGAKKAAGVQCRWHDLRDSCASRLAGGGAADQTLQALLGWMSPKMIEKYSHVRAEAKRKAVRAFDESEDRKGPTNFHHNKTDVGGENPVTI